MNMDEAYTRLGVAYEQCFKVHHELCRILIRGQHDEFLADLRDVIYSTLKLQEYLKQTIESEVKHNE